MPQFRLTKKFAADCKIIPLETPLLVSNVFDDWVIDVIRITRKKVAIVTHVTSVLTFLIPYVPAYIEKCLIEWLKARQLDQATKEVNLFFQGSLYFNKTENRQVLSGPH